MADNPLSLSLKARVKILEEENSNLKRQLQNLSKLLPQDSTINVSDEQMICEMEIRRLRDIALNRSLNLEETKKLDILLKNLKSIKQTTKEQVIEIKKVMDVSLNELIEMTGEDGKVQENPETGSDS